ncbi:NLR family CARD domain-containing protein 3-like [Thunnus albacares]|uniref:NLR family CARD domain-containing protein 3-like n=1 Tax=Thunnus albacares TaxID=8236 RepID=UPI001CF660F0|nr:NLR family CARD domain-containing protein 3-like [Thunnus albacares]
MIDWANGKSNQNIDLIVPLHFSGLNSKRDEVQSMEDLLHFFTSIKLPVVCSYHECEVVFVLDGLEECEFPLDFEENKELSDMKEPASMDVLLTNLIKGNLLPSAHLWIISQPSGVDKIPTKYIHKETECQETLKRRQQLVSNLKKRYQENTHVEDKNHPDQQNTEHIMKEDRSGEINDEENNGQTVVKSVTRVNAISEIFKCKKGQTVRTVLTTGEAGIGKSFHAQKSTQEWAKNENQPSFSTRSIDSTKAITGNDKDDLEVIFPLRFSELNSIKKQRVSLLGLLNYFFKETKESVISNYANFKVLFVLDGLDDYELPLDFDNNDTLMDIREPASVDVLLTNLIRGNLLRSAQLWITSRPSAAEKLPDKLVDKKTQIRVKPDVESQWKLKSQLKKQFNLVSEGIDKQKISALLNEIYTDLYIVEGERGDVNRQNEARQVQDAKFKPMREETPIKYHDIFKPSGENKPIRIVLTTGMAGIGKTFASMKYMLDWAECMANKDIHYTFPLPFRELNLRKGNEHSLEDLIHQFFPVMQTSEITDYNKYKILIVLDGLDECRLDLDFSECNSWTDVRKPTSVNVLLENLIQGNLLPKAQIWITSRPAASNNIPAVKVDRVTEVRGFNDEQKEEYFRKRFSDKDLAEKILSHVKKSRSIYIMCHIPVFCWLTAKVLEDFVSRKQEEGMPKTLTDMYIYFLLLQCRQANVKYGGDEVGESSETESCWNTRNKATVLSLAKLAFEELEKGNLLFTEEHLTEREIDITETAVFSGLFTQIKREGRGQYQQKLFCFVHLSIQEFLAAFYVSHTFNNTGENLLIKPASTVADLPASDFYKTAVNKALDSKNGDWDLFLRFLLGLSLETYQTLLQELLKKTENNNKTNKETIEYIKEKIREEISDADQNLNLFHCLNELNDDSLMEEVKKCLHSRTLAFENFSAYKWSALTFALLTSDENLDVFDLKKYLKSERVLLGMLPVVKVSKTTLLSWCELSHESCKGLSSSVLRSASSNLTELDLSHNDLLDSGVQLLADGLESLQCKLEILKLSGCQVTEKGCSLIASALKSNTASHLKHLDLSYNHPGDNGAMMLSAIAEDPNMKLKTLCLDHGGEHRLKLGLKKYCEDLRLDENTASSRLVLSEGNKGAKTMVTVKEKMFKPDNKERFKWNQVLCEEGLKGFCYWEVEWRGTVSIAVAYKEVGRTLDRDGGLGCNEKSWSLLCSKTGYKAMHGKDLKDITVPPCQKIAVFLDWEGGTLTYYSVTSGELNLIHTFHTKFTEPLYPGFWFKKGSATLCKIG